MPKRRVSAFAVTISTKELLREVFKVLQAPPVGMIRAALEQSRSKIQTRLDWIESERARLAHEERLAEERAKLAAERISAGSASCAGKT